MANNKIQVMTGSYPVTVLEAVKVGDGTDKSLKDMIDNGEIGGTGGTIASNLGMSSENVVLHANGGFNSLEIEAQHIATGSQDVLVYFSRLDIKILDLSKTLTINFSSVLAISGIETRKTMNGNTGVIIPNGYTLVATHSSGAVSLKDSLLVTPSTELVLLRNRTGQASGHLVEYNWQKENKKDTSFKNIKPIFTRTTTCGTNEGTHPSVLYFASGWNGYKYWMVQTPYPLTRQKPYRDTWEDPYIYCSNDGVDFDYPPGISNPIAPNTTLNGSYNSDPHLVYRSDLNRLECWYRYTYTTLNNATKILRRYSTDGVNWSNEELLIDLVDGNTTVGDMVRSHSVIWDGTKYRMWFTDDPTKASCKLCYSEAINPVGSANWSVKQTCATNYKSFVWHSDVYLDNGTYYYVNYDRTGLHLYTSSDGLTFKYTKELILQGVQKTTEFWAKLYRACILKAGDTWLMYFTGETDERASIFLMAGKTLDTLQFVDGNFFSRKQVFQKGIEIVNTNYVANEIKLTDKGTCIGVDYDTEKVYIKKSDGTKVYLN